MKRGDWLPWLLLGFVVGFVLAVWLLSTDETPPPDDTEAKTQRPGRVIDIFEAAS